MHICTMHIILFFFFWPHCLANLLRSFIHLAIAGVRNPKALTKAKECGIALLQGKGQNVDNPWFHTWPLIIIQHNKYINPY
jgi:hypothetical protein